MLEPRTPETPTEWGYRFADNPGAVITSTEDYARQRAQRDYSVEVVSRSPLSRGEWVAVPSRQPDGVVR